MGQEGIDDANDRILLDAADFQWNAQSKRIKNVADPTAAQDAATKNYLESTWLSTADKANLTSVAAVSTEIGRLGTVAAVADLAILGTTPIVADLDAVADKVTEIGRLGTADAVADLAILGTADIVTDMNLLATGANVTAMGLLGLSGVIANMALLGTSDAVADMNKLATTDIVADLNTLATTDIVSDLNQLATSDFVSDLNAIEAVKANVTTCADNLTGINNFAARYRVDSTNPTGSLDEGDLFFNTSDNALKYYNGSSWASITAGIGSLADDTTPELGGDLSLNGNNIDFPTTPNISDCLDEDTMSSNSATKLATQQSIKAYADSIEGSVITTVGSTFANYNSIGSNVTTTLVATKNYFLAGIITVADTYTWDVAGSGTLNII